MALGGLLASFGFVGPASSGTPAGARVFTEGLNIKLDRTSPAFAALEDTWTSSDTKSQAAISLGPAIQLEAGVSALALAERIEKANHREQALVAQERASREATSQAMAQAAAEVLRKMASHFEARPLPTPAPAQQEVAAEAPAEPTKIVKTISLTDLRMSREELLGSLFLPIAKTAPEGGAMVAGYHPVRQAPQLGGLSKPRPSNNGAGRVGTQALLASADFVGDDAPQMRTLHQVVISGPLEFTDGLALSNTLDRVVVYHDVDGEQQEAGAVWIREGRYEIFVEETSGDLVGELRTPYGDVIGRGSFDLRHLPAGRLDQRKVSPVALSIKPVPQGIAGRVTSFKGSATVPTPVKAADVAFRDLPLNSTTLANGRYEQTALLEGSSAIVKVSRPGYWGTLAFAHAGQESDFEIFPNQDGQMIHHLIALSRAGGPTASKPAAIIWGRVKRGGQPLAGARVELMTSAQPTQPIYFNAAMVPDPSLTETSANGLYAFYPVAPGAHAVQVILGNDETADATEPLVFPTEDKTVSRVDIETATERHAKVKVFDAFQTDHPLAAEVVNPGSAKGFVVERSGVGEFRYASGRGLLILDADAGRSYERIRIATSRDRGVVYIPMVATAWLEQMRGAMRVNVEPGTGTIVGFVQGQSPYKIAMEERSLTAASRVIYFNRAGQMLSQDYGEPGGGFVIFNVPEGFRTVTVQPSGSQKIHASVTLVERNMTNVISHWIR